MLKTLSDGVRPILTYVFASMYILVSTWGVFAGKIEFPMYFAQIGTMVGMMVSFYFGEKSALKNPMGDNNANA